MATAVDGGDMRRGKDNVGNLDGASLLSSEAKLEVVSPLPFFRGEFDKRLNFGTFMHTSLFQR